LELPLAISDSKFGTIVEITWWRKERGERKSDNNAWKSGKLKAASD
jgi:hypothetical protein